ncbi:hypothetical protein CPS_1127 [Colwellia psychrerythraea 34H]|uniref:Uncharacterized protein n=1 Tax=Colwellia psychrerythraea (strain 34H / ATCC BAA-681) TaxID=167879 RepID=Q486Z5_COLP3|nr:hypothetical protein CPS_1127 [Colwellia psychrerythraea 34H]
MLWRLILFCYNLGELLYPLDLKRASSSGKGIQILLAKRIT